MFEKKNQKTLAFQSDGAARMGVSHEKKFLLLFSRRSACLRSQPSTPGPVDITPMTPRLGAILSRPRGDRILVLVAGGAALWAIWLLGLSFLAGTGPFWSSPRGSIGHGWADMVTPLAGYRYFQRGTWQWPLLTVPELGFPAGTNLTLTDSIPVLSILGRIVYELSGTAVNLFGLWIGFCFVGAAVSFALLVRLLGGRSGTAAFAAGLFGFTMPPLLFRWGHPALMAQFEITLALALYVWRRRSAGIVPAAATICLSVVSLLTSSYLFLMVMAIVGAMYGRAMFVSARPRRGLLAEAALLAVVLAGLVLALGSFPAHGSLRGEGYGIFSFNLLGAFIPQRSGLFPGMSRLVVDGTGGQYEGLAYPGLGLLSLAGIACVPFPDKIRFLWRHFPLMACLALFTALSLSNKIMAGPWHLVTLPLPSFLLSKLEIVRASGRFIWPPIYAVSAFAVAVVSGRRWGTSLLIIAAVLNLADTAPLARTIREEIASPPVPPVSFSALSAIIKASSAVFVAPVFECLPNPPGWSKALDAEIELAAATMFVPTNTVYQGRPTADCEAAQKAVTHPSVRETALRVYLPEWPGYDALRAAKFPNCAAGEKVVICGGAAAAQDLAAAVHANPDWRAPADQPWM